MKLSDLKSALNAELIGQDVSFDAISIDTRTLPQECLFIAIEGERFDGHEFVGEALKQGAKAVVVSKKKAVPANTNALLVSDSIEALGKLARYHRSQYELPCVGITGSCGKTSVKGMMGTILNSIGKTLVTSGNFNNHIGLPLTLLQLKPDHQFAVIEMGASGPYEITYLSSLARPTVAVITNVHPAHLEGFGSLKGVAKAKGEIYESLDAHGTAVLNLDCEYAPLWKKLIDQRRTITFGSHKQAMFKLLEVKTYPLTTEMTYQSPQGTRSLTLQVPGAHNAMNALTCLACTYALGLPLVKAEQALTHFEGISGRLKRVTLKNGIEIIDDTYNANPGSMEAALSLLASISGPSLFVMGEMAELGGSAPQWHAQIGQKAKELGVGQLWSVGPLTQDAVEAFGDGGQRFPNKQALLDALLTLKTPMTVLVKGSRSAALETLINDLKAREDS